ncbi:lipase family protein [Nocardia arthritidis]|uniref:Prolyl oligopeptidase family serine peptidase n=1 Tax=Nocardia arthritidis TaxID=228602 RepID=A0A6G9YS12_9NOCA|nr:lipase family protein [Nocardia arthritidis]QIS15910.1 prolyl oligopeptidase family serine peptidase [Nocardia arthritidis]
MIRRLFGSAVLAAGFACCVAGAGTTAAQAVPDPTADPFYAAPADLGASPNGAILKSREIAPGGLPLPVKSWQVQYKSLDSHGGPTTGVATVLVPVTPWTGPGARPLVSYQLAIDSIGSRCAPSYSIRAGLGAGIDNANAEAPVTAIALQRNWAVVIPDYQGPQERFLDGPQAAHQVLDAVRAARAFGADGLTPDSPLGAMGYSAGAFATAWAMEQQPSYAPELHFAGFAAGGIPTEPREMIRSVDGGPSFGLALLMLAAIDHNHPELDVPALLNDRGKAVLAQFASACGTDFQSLAFQRMDQFTTQQDIASNPRLAAALDSMQLGRTAPSTPAFIWHSTGDNILPIAGTDHLVDTWCAAGASITYTRTAIPTHLGAAADLPTAFNYLGDRFSGRPPAPGCARN